MQRLSISGEEPNYERLWHGTRLTDPALLWESRDGMCINFSAEGLWGRGNYFAVNASYSVGYSHRHQGEDQDLLGFFFADVLVGEYIELPSSRKYTMPPLNPAAGDNVHYDSIKGRTGGSAVYITYHNRKSYPSYYVMYKSDKK